MKVTGYALKNAIQRRKLKLDIAYAQFQDNKHQFDGQQIDLEDLFNQYRTAEREIAQIQTWQAQYNIAVTVNVLGEDMPLLQAIKLVGGAGRAEKLWKEYAKEGDQSKNRFGGSSRSHDADYAKRAMSVEACEAQAEQASRYASALREAIQIGNGQEIEFAIDAALLR